MRLRNVFIAFLLGAAIAAGITLALRMSAADAVPLRATIVPPGEPLPEFSLLDQDGAAIGRDVFEGQWDLVFFGFTHCPDVCPTTLSLLGQVRQRLAALGQQPLPRIVLVSVDPERDTPAAIAQYVGLFGNDNLGVTGDVDEIRKLARALGIYFQKTETDGDDYSIDHSAVVLVLDPRGRLRALFSGPHRVEDFVHDLPLVMKSR